MYKKLYSIKRSATILGACLLISGCLATAPEPLTAEQQAQADQLRAAFISRLQAGNAQLQNAQSASAQRATPTPTQNNRVERGELIKQMKVIQSSGGPATFSIERDGILVNQSMYLDPEGSVEKAGWDVLSGDFTYTVVNFDGSKSLKFYRAGSSANPMLIGNIRQNQNSIRIELIDGQVMAGNSFIPTSNGVIVSRGASVFEYKIGQQLSSSSIPQGWNVAQLQRGDVDSTGLILLERDKADKIKKAGFGGVLSGFNEIGRSFGITEIFDYALYDIKTGQSALLNMSINDKEVTVLSNCVRQNDYVNKCSDANSYNSLYETDGRRNRLHYFWSLDWFTTPAGPMAVYNSGSKLIAVDMVSMQKLTLFERSLGVNGFNLEQSSVGTISLNVQLGFSAETIPDLSQYIASETLESTPVKSI